jgi:hypothetical protein
LHFFPFSPLPRSVDVMRNIGPHSATLIGLKQRCVGERYPQMGVSSYLTSAKRPRRLVRLS